MQKPRVSLPWLPLTLDLRRRMRTIQKSERLVYRMLHRKISSAIR